MLLLFVFIGTNAVALVLRRDAVAHPHFRVWTLMPLLGVASCVLLLIQQSVQVWRFGALFVKAGLALHALAQLERNRFAST